MMSGNRASRVRDRAFNGCEVLPELEFCGHRIDKPQSFLNEARLSALALAIYFAGRQVCAPTIQPDTPHLMVLDDALIGLDQSNRLPILRLLGKYFSGWQVILLTHDRVWYEMARFYLADNPTWAALELFEMARPDGRTMAAAGHIHTLVKPKSIDAVADGLASARKFLGDGEYAAAAVHARIAFEMSLKKQCMKKAIPVRFKDDPREVTTNELLNAVEAWLDGPKGAGSKGALTKPIADVKLYRSVVLNPYSHSTPVSLTHAEVEGAIGAVEALHRAFKTGAGQAVGVGTGAHDET